MRADFRRGDYGQTHYHQQSPAEIRQTTFIGIVSLNRT